MTIKDFALLCRCNAQTLRYYDRIGLLRPARVDRYSGYRYYDERQALDFIRIRNLQSADFSIGEIRQLLTCSEEEIDRAFEAKIAAQQEKLQRIIQIKQDYLRERNGMDQLLQTISGALTAGVDVQSGERAFGLQAGEGEQVMETLRGYMIRQLASAPIAADQVWLQVDDEVVHGTADALERVEALGADLWNHTVLLGDEDKAYQTAVSELLWRLDGWQQPAEVLARMPMLKAGEEYCLRCSVPHMKPEESVTFTMFLLGLVVRDRNGADAIVNCDLKDESPDGLNRVSLERRLGA